MSLGMEIGGKPEPMPADYLYRMIPVMEALASLEPGDFNNRIRLSSTFRWTNDQMAALSSPQELLTEVPAEQEELRARISWNWRGHESGKWPGIVTLTTRISSRAMSRPKKPLTLQKIRLTNSRQPMPWPIAWHFACPGIIKPCWTCFEQARDWFEKFTRLKPSKLGLYVEQRYA